jgi:hypothetical protein
MRILNFAKGAFPPLSSSRFVELFQFREIYFFATLTRFGDATRYARLGTEHTIAVDFNSPNSKERRRERLHAPFARHRTAELIIRTKSDKESF